MTQTDQLSMLQKQLSPCKLCPHLCMIDRNKGKRGFCQSDSHMEIAYAGLHYGEEPPFTGTSGSGAIFFLHCNMACVYCQNYQISQPSSRTGKAYTPEECADIMIALASKGAHNINLVSPTHYSALIAESILLARKRGLSLPIIYNTNGYDLAGIINLLDGLIDIYLADMRYSLDQNASAYSKIAHYTDNNREAVRTMFEQVGNLKFDAEDLAIKGILVRLLILPEDISGSIETLDFLSTVSTDIHISIMSQYTPLHHAKRYPPLSRSITSGEYKKVLDYALEKGFTNIWSQELDSSSLFNPDFSKDTPFDQ